MRISTLALALAGSFVTACSCSPTTDPTDVIGEPSIALSNGSLHFTVAMGAASPSAEFVTVSNGGAGSLAPPTPPAITYVSGSGWLAATVSGSAAPYTLTVEPSTSALAAGSYAASVAIASAGASNSPQTLAVYLTVTAEAPSIALSTSILSFTATAGGANPLAQPVTVTNSGSGTLEPTTSIAYGGAASGWLTATVSAEPYTVSVQPALGSLDPGTYGATVSVASPGASNSPQPIQVSFTVLPSGGTEPAIGLSPTSLSFSASAGGPNPDAKTVAVSNEGGGTLEKPPTPTISYPGVSGWLEVSVSGTEAPYTITVRPSIAGLGGGTYHATVSVQSSGAANSPQTFNVSLTVTAVPTIALSPTSLSFSAVEGGAPPSQKTVMVSNVGGGTLAQPTTSIAYGPGGTGWLTAPNPDPAEPGAPYTITAQPNPGTLAVGTYTATVSVFSSGASNSPQTFGVTFTVVAQPTSCKIQGDACSGGTECCSAICAFGACTTAKFCGSGGTPCTNDNDCCSMNCTDAGSPGATCSAEPCKEAGLACGSGAECCSGTCTGGSCELLGGATCKTLGERCTGALQCCSKNCQGLVDADNPGWCAPAYSCNATGDICYREEDCCSGICKKTDGAAASDPGRCETSPGGCTQDGIPCDNDSNCCTRRCLDLGGGKVCQPSGGCRMTGNYCDTTFSCCGGTNSDDPTQFNEYGVFCDNVGTNPDYPEWDTKTTDKRVCTAGTGCNPPGNICGYKASQNCCFEGSGSGKQVCKEDVNGILRCFGGPLNDTCLSGWDGDDPNCCIQIGDVCQFRDQCCNFAPCVPDDVGILRCTDSSPACDPTIQSCGPPCVSDGGSCTVDGDCCTGGCDVPPGSTHGTCRTGASACSATWQACSLDTDCCEYGLTGGDICDGGICQPAPTCSTGTCSAGPGGECCPGYECLATDEENVWPCRPEDLFCFCDAPVCIPMGDPCQAGEPCCAGTFCVNDDEANFPCDPEAGGCKCLP
jgi:hypothetical protein